MVSSRLPVLIGLVPLLSSLVIGEALPHNQVCVAALYEVYGAVTFEGIGSDDYWVGLCQNPAKVTSIYASAKVYCNPDDIQPGFGYLEGLCKQYGYVSLLPESEVATNLTSEAISRMDILDMTDVDPAVNVTKPFLISRAWFDLGYRTEETWDFEMRTHMAYAYAMFGFWGVVLIIGMLARFTNLVYERLMASLAADDESNGSRIHGILCKSRFHGTMTTAVSFTRKHISTPSPLGTYRRRMLYGCTIPTRMEAFVVFSFWAVSIILCSVNYRGFPGNLYWPDVSAQLWRYISDRTGIIAYANLPILWMFSGRNNIFIWLTGWQFSTFNLFHKHIARVATVEAIIHSVGYTAFYYVGGYWDDYLQDYKDPWFYLGVLGVIAMSFLVIFSFSWFRRKIYESFLLIHIILSVVVIVALFYHTSIFEGEYDPYLWPLVAIWSLDRLIRILRVIYCNIHVSFRKGRSVHYTNANVSYDSDANMIRIDVIPGAKHLRPGPGQHYYLYQPFRLTGWENHPFTLASWTAALQPAPSESLTSPVTPNTNTSPTLSFWVRPYDGWTKHLRAQCARSQATSISTILLIEGPYGKPEPLWVFEELLLIAGGSGIAAIVPYLHDYVHRSEHRTTRTRAITILWTDRSEKFIRRTAQTSLSAVLALEGITTQFYCTASRHHASSSSSSGSSSPLVPVEEAGDDMLVKEVRLPRSANVELEAPAVIHGRPNIPDIIRKTAVGANESRSRLGIMVCGPAGLADEARDAAWRCMDQSSNSVFYFEEAFGW